MIEQMMDQLRHDDPMMRFEAAQALGASNDPRAVAPLIGALSDENAKVQYAAVSGLVKLGDASAAKPIIDLLLSEPDSRLWELLKLNVGMRLRNGLLDMVQRGDVALADQLADVLASDMLDEQQVAFVIRLLGRTADARAVEMLIDRLLEDTPTIQVAAAEALGSIGDPSAVAPLMLFLTDDADTVREVAIEALGRLGDTRAVRPLIEALKDDAEWVRRAACVALGVLGDRSAMEPLATALKDETTLVQDAAFDAIKQLSENYQ